jgi:putative ABC transport system substrate-binding protein
MFTAALYEVLVLGPLVAAADQESAIGVRPLNRLEGSKAAGAGGLVIFEDPLTLSQRSEIAAVAGRLRLPAIYGYREFAEAGGLMPYGTNHGAQWRRGAEIVVLILKGAKPTDIPVEQPTKFELVVNLKTAKASNFTVPPTIMLRADEVIE